MRLSGQSIGMKRTKGDATDDFIGSPLSSRDNGLHGWQIVDMSAFADAQMEAA